ncbi:hypothetical protein [Pleomorphomonas sp. PLEO]|uniref:hypothetical protein n=1 Tax=Pleomorphomonas sp. PLEO TaxID=3239306 RepID=UPI00351EE3A8
MMPLSQVPPTTDSLPLLPVTTLRELHHVAEGMETPLCRMDGMLRAMSALAERFGESPDRAAIADVINIAEGFISEIDGAREHLASALRPYGERMR